MQTDRPIAQQDHGGGGDESGKARIAARRDMIGEDLAERATCKDRPLARCRRHVAHLRSGLRRKPRRSEGRDKIPDTATWIDLEEPTKEEEALVERCIHLNVPTKSEMAEIEPSSRLFERNGALYMTVSVLFGVRRVTRNHAHSFVLADNRLVTVRYATPNRYALYRPCAPRARPRPRAPTALVRMLDAIIDRLADEIEDLGSEIEKFPTHFPAIRSMSAGSPLPG